MDYGYMVSQSYEYAKEGLVGKWKRWILLVICMFIQAITIMLVPLYSGYLFRVLQGQTPAPEIDQWKKLFVDGWRWNIVALLYAIIPIAIFLIFGGMGILTMVGGSAAMGGDPSSVVGVVSGSLFGAGIVLTIIAAIIMLLIYAIGVVRFAKKDSVKEGFNFSEIFGHIRAIGWLNYIAALIILILVTIVIGIIMMLILSIPILGWIIYFFIWAWFGLFYARYLVAIYESAPEAA